MATVGQFSRSIAHEIKNPLNFISLSVDHMRDAYRPADADTAARYESLIDNIKGEVRGSAALPKASSNTGAPSNCTGGAVPSTPCSTRCSNW